MQKPILVFGGLGQLGQCIEKVAGLRGFENMIYLDEVNGNILNTEVLNSLFDKHKPAWVINCAAYTAVDKAEDEQGLAYKINCEGASNLAGMCKKYGARLLHISTDFVFEGNRTELLEEEDEAKPVGVYGASKLEGELAIAAELEEYFIIRTSWLYSEFAANFVKTMLRLGREKNELSVIVDQLGSPTYAVDLAETLLSIIESGKDAYGIYHYSNEGAISWYDFAKAIFELAGIDIKVNAIPGSAYPTKAKRPNWSVMDKSKIKATFGLEIPYWRTSLKECLKALTT